MIETDVNTASLVEYFESKGYGTVVTNDIKIIPVYSNKNEELNSLCKGVGLRNISHYNITELRGKDVLDFLHRVSTNSVKELAKEAIAGTVFTTEKGRIIDTAKILNFGDFQLLISSAANKVKITRWIEKYVIADDVKVGDANEKYCLLELLGPQADSFITLVCGGVVNEIGINKFKIITSEGMIFFLIKIKDKNSREKFWILADINNSKKLIEYMTENKGIFTFNLIGEESYNEYRITEGIPAAPNELNDQFNPHEANLLDLVSFTKGCYIGQEVIARLDTYDKVQKYLTGISFYGHADKEQVYKIYDDGKEIGIVTSAVYSARFNKSIGLAFIRRSYNEDGRKFLAKAENDKTVEVTVNSLPFRK